MISQDTARFLLLLLSEQTVNVNHPAFRETTMSIMRAQDELQALIEAHEAPSNGLTAVGSQALDD